MGQKRKDEKNVSEREWREEGKEGGEKRSSITD